MGDELKQTGISMTPPIAVLCAVIFIVQCDGDLATVVDETADTGPTDSGPDSYTDADAPSDTGTDSYTAGLADTGSDSYTDAPTDTETDIMPTVFETVDSSAVTDSDSETGSGECSSPWGWYDKTSGLCWENPPTSTEALIWDDALAYCDALVLGGYNDWRLPSISEMRSFVRGCDTTITGGECDVTDECVPNNPEGNGCGGEVCETGCWDSEGPGVGGCFWDAEIKGDCKGYQSSTPADLGYYVWIIQYGSGAIWRHEKNETWLRCVRTGLL